ncbi:acyltransferase family protein [Paenibacillus harenae]|uniref:Peptidoglycan/LPS O-acetylase OafA/YrhL n=1 Tax=Paenibacillus harenae TaxID=306543 RepID=A0ABT9U9C5_PAEHA|nr:acyltransferase family protein [Paenibacillus harenae]MDQ0116256.1 peptidoglycan/LPS O-acetylase OafA/YrhL [Paenibacillus harenae]
MPKPIGNSSRYMPGLDGLRAIAVLAVIAYHVSFDWTPGGLLGVTMFFVLSGYLITDLLLAQWSEHKRIDFKTFWLRRARRLLPAMFIMLGLVSLWLFLTDTGRLYSIGGDIGSALLYISNWWLIFHDVSYFESFGPPSPLGHFWSLAVEEQFYLIWPIALLGALQIARMRGQLLTWTIAAAAISACLMTLLYTPGEDPSRVYYGTDTRAFALLIGASLAIVWPSRKLASNITLKSRFALNLLGSIGLIVMIAMIVLTKEYDSFLYQGGMVVASLATAAIVAAIVHPAVKLGYAIGFKPLRWLGVRSYGIYLYHYPIIVLSTPQADFGEFHAVRALLQVAATLAIAEWSWRYIEEPIRRGALARLFAEFRSSTRLLSFNFRKMMMLLPTALLVTVSVSYASHAELLHEAAYPAGSTPEPPYTEVGNTPAPSLNPGGSGDTEHAGYKPESTSKPPVSKPTEKPAPTPKPTNATEPEATQTPPNPATEVPPLTQPTETPDNGSQPEEPVVKDAITIIGDSVILNAAPYLVEQFPNLTVDGKVGRQMSDASEVIDAFIQSGKLGDIVVIELGTNGSFKSKLLYALLDSIGSERRILLVNSRVPREWQDDVNKTLAEAAEKYDNVSLVDWYSASKGKDDLFNKDGVHLGKEGSVYYAKLIADAING